MRPLGQLNLVSPLIPSLNNSSVKQNYLAPMQSEKAHSLGSHDDLSESSGPLSKDSLPGMTFIVQPSCSILT